MKATVTYYDAHTDTMQVKVGTHEIQYGGANGDTYCYVHQTFDCHDNLTKTEVEALNNKEWEVAE